MDVKVLGSGCASCRTLEARAAEALADAGLEATIEKVTDDGDIVSWGVMSTPALVVDGTVVVSGRVPSIGELRRMLAGTGS